MLGLGLALLLLFLAVPASAGPMDHPGYVKTATCSACHGFAGNSRSNTMPILAGMNSAYLKKALEDYASGKRPSPEMEPFAKQAIALGVDDVVAYLSSQARQPTPVAPDPAAVTRGRSASQQCVICHGPAGKGDAAKGIPDLTAQPAGYLKHQMELFKADRRSPGDEPLKAMKALMKTIPDAQVDDLAAYYSSLR